MGGSRIGMNERLPGRERRRLFLDAAMPLAEKHGFRHVSRDMVAQACSVSPALLSRYYSAVDFRKAIMERAVATENLRVLAEGLVARHPVALAAPLALRKAAVLSVVAS